MTRKMKHQHVSKICFCLLATSLDYDGDNNYTCEESIADRDANHVEKDENDYADLIPVKCHSWPL